MPIFEYEDEETGLRVDVVRPFEDRNKPLVLKRVPSLIGVNMGAATEETDFNKRMIKGYHQLEEKEGSRFSSEHSAATINKNWKE